MATRQIAYHAAPPLKTAGAIVAPLTPDDEARLREALWTPGENALERVLRSEQGRFPNKGLVEDCGFLHGPKGIPIKRCSSEICKNQD